LATAIGTTDRNIFKLFNDVTKSISLDLLERFSEFLYSYTNDSSFKLETLEKDILYIRSWGANSGKIFNPKFPLNFDCRQGGIIIGSLMGDGGVRKDYRPFYTNSDKNRVMQVVNNFKELIGDFETSNLTKTHSPTKEGSITYSYDFYKIIGYILCYGLNMIPGDKNYADPWLPKFSLNASTDFKINLISSFFTDEATVHRAGEDLAPQISLRQVKIIKHEKDRPPKRMLDMVEVLNSLELRPVLFLEDTYNNDGTEKGIFNLSIGKIDDTRRFFQMIGFFSDKKNKKLKEALEKTKRKISAEEYFRNKTLNSVLPVLKACTTLSSQKTPITSKNVCKILNRRRDSVKSVLNRMVLLDIIKLKERGLNIHGKRSCDVFELKEENLDLTFQK